MLDTEIYTLFNVSVADNLVDDDSDSVRSYVINNPSATMVEFVWHALLLRSICLDVDDVADAVGDEVGGELDETLLY